MQPNAYAQPYSSDSGDVGVLFCHGFSGSPWSLLEWAQVTAAAGYRVRLPRLPGHGTSWQELNTTQWRDWYDCVSREFNQLAAHCSKVFVTGLSMGGALALRLAEKHPDKVAGLVLVNPAVQAKLVSRAAPLLQHFVGSVKAIGEDIAAPNVLEHAYNRTPVKAVASMLKMWTDVRACLDLVVCPVLLFRSLQDHVVPAASSRTILTHISSDEITERCLERSYHVATMDYDKQQIFDESLAFFAAH
ncbi:MAG: alpha/beta fold hydrolase [Propionibacteriaceae bacterium]|jgi:carboxylesterase|nr:alpha/beta fold hydrolase [Propionibacteriaceae bacterium]